MSAARHVFNYAILRYLPFPEQGEFVNVAVVAHGSELRWFGYAGGPDDVGRVTQFFPQVSAGVYLKQRQAMFAELERVRELLLNSADPALARRIFLELVRPRESVFRFGEVRTVMGDDPEALLVQLCECYAKPRQPAVELAPA
jgi:hypothetical protein